MLNITKARRWGRIALAALSASAVAVSLASCSGGASTGGGGDSEGPIKVASLVDETGALSGYGTQMRDATRLAIKDINANGGVLGRQLEAVEYDTRSDNQAYAQYANQALQSEGADVLFGGITSASREVIRPIADRAETLYFYQLQYEGGLCDRNTFATGSVPSQEMASLIPYMVENYGKKIYIVAADYNWGQISAQWVEKYAEELGAEVVGTDFVPLESSDFGSVITNLQNTQPDVVISLTVGGNHLSFYRQFDAAGLGEKMKIAGSAFGQGNEHVVLGEAGEGVVSAYPYFMELENPANEKFVTAWREEYGEDYGYIVASAANTWAMWHVWAEAVNEAGTLDRESVLEVLETGEISYEAPSGTVTVDGPSHHVVHDITLAESNGEGGFNILETKTQVPPSFEQSVCDLIANPDTNEQFLP